MTEQFLEWLKKLIATDNLEKFYHCKEWLQVAAAVRKLDHNECYICRSKGILTTNTTLNSQGNRIQMSVHHRKEVKQFPELALSIYYMDANGQQHRNLVYICERCHNREHNRFGRNQNEKKLSKKDKYYIRYTNEERW